MRLQSAITVVLLVSCLVVGVVLSAPQGETSTETGKPLPSARSRFALPKLFDFNQFKQLFNRAYRSLTEELARKKLYLGRAFRAFISAISYKHGKSSSYLAINEMSDWTPQEVKKVSINRELLSGKIDSMVKLGKNKDLNSDSNIPAASLEDIKQELDEIVTQHKNEPGYTEIAKELTQIKTRKKREAPGKRPYWEEPALVRSEPDSVGPMPMPFEQASYFKSLPGVGYLESTIHQMTDMFSFPSSTKKEESDLHDVVHIDHRSSGCFPEVRSQGLCGACYIFSTIALLEWKYCTDTGKLVEFSEQYPIDCGRSKGLGGCDGGDDKSVLEFVEDYGLELRSNYPFQMYEEKCPYDDSTHPNSMGYIRMSDPGYMIALYEHLDFYLENRPILAAVVTSSGFFEYGGGIDDPSDCTGDEAHAVLMVGSGREDGKEYLIFRNSHGTSFGKDGHYRLKRDSKCLLFDHGVIIRSKARFDDDHNINPEYDGRPIKERYPHVKD